MMLAVLIFVYAMGSAMTLEQTRHDKISWQASAFLLWPLFIMLGIILKTYWRWERRR